MFFSQFYIWVLDSWSDKTNKKKKSDNKMDYQQDKTGNCSGVSGPRGPRNLSHLMAGSDGLGP